MTSPSDIRAYETAVTVARRLGFNVLSTMDFHIVPGDNDAVPIYSRDATIASFATVDGMLTWLRGYSSALDYTAQMGFTKKKLAAAEQKVRNRQLMAILKHTQHDHTA